MSGSLALAAGLMMCGSPDWRTRERGSVLLDRADRWEYVYRFATHHPEPEVRRRCWKQHLRHASRFVDGLPDASYMDSPLAKTHHYLPLVIDAIYSVYPDAVVDDCWSVDWFHLLRPGYYDRGEGVDFSAADAVVLRMWAGRLVRSYGPRAVLTVRSVYWCSRNPQVMPWTISTLSRVVRSAVR